MANPDFFFAPTLIPVLKLNESGDLLPFDSLLECHLSKTKMIGHNYNVIQEVTKDENMASRVVLQRDFSKLEIDKGIENCWKWEWLEQSNKQPVGQFIRKIDSREVARCQLCQNINWLIPLDFSGVRVTRS